MSAPASLPSNEQLFLWAQQTYPELFGSVPPQASSIQYDGKLFDVRFYGATKNYLGISNGIVYGLGPFTGGELRDFGAVANFASLVCASVSCQGVLRDSINECSMPASQALITGNRVSTVSIFTTPGQPPWEVNDEEFVAGPASFEGESAVLVRKTVSSNRRIANIDYKGEARILSYRRTDSRDIQIILGEELENLVNGSLSFSIKDVYRPPDPETEFLLTAGNSTTRTTSSSTTITDPPPKSTSRTEDSTVSYTYTFEGQERITVAAGTFDTCRYRMSSTTVSGEGVLTTWYVVGYGIAAKSMNVTDRGVDTTELKSAIVNGRQL